MIRRIPALAVWASLCVAAAAHAQVQVKDAWVRATVPGQRATGAFMQLQSGQGAKLLSASSHAASIVEIHEMAMNNDVMTMRQVAAIDLPAGKTVDLKPGGYHIMLIDLKQQAKEGDVVPLTLEIEGVDGKRQSLEVKADVRLLNASAMPRTPVHQR